MAERPTYQFNKIFPAWEIRVRPLLEGNCSEAYANYRNPAEQSNLVTYLLVNCLLEEFPEYRKAEMATAALVLGLTPFIIQQMGPRVTDVGTLALRRPLLALLIAASCPIVSADMAGTFSDPVRHLSRKAVKTTKPKMRWLDLSRRRRGVIIAVAAAEYLLALATCVNIQVLAWQLGTWTVCIYSPDVMYQPFLWVNLAILIQAAHTLSLLLRVKVLSPVSGTPSLQQSSRSTSGLGSSSPTTSNNISLATLPQGSIALSTTSLAQGSVPVPPNTFGSAPSNTPSQPQPQPQTQGVTSTSVWCRARPWPFRSTTLPSIQMPQNCTPLPSAFPLLSPSRQASIRTFFRREFTPNAYADPLELRHREHGYLYLFLGYIVSASAAAHVLFGTLLLSSLVFISLADAVGIIWRFSASTIICRMLLGYEMTAMREQVSGVEYDDD